MKNILLLVHDDNGQEARLQAALDLARALGGHLMCLDVTPFAVAAGEFYVGMGPGTLIVDEHAQEAANKQRITARLAHEDVPWDWSDVTGDIADCLIDAAKMADIVVMNRALDSFPLPAMRDIASRVLMDAGRPVMAVPETQRRLSFDRALLAWDGRESAAETMQAAVPLLKLAREVEIFTVKEGGDRTDPEAAAEYLSRQDIHTLVRTMDDRIDPIDNLIIEEATRWRADYVVMGAYSRGRLREMLGGVTKRLLKNSPLPLLLGH